MILSQDPDTNSFSYQALFEQDHPLQKRLGMGMNSVVYTIRGTDLVAKISALTTPHRYHPKQGKISSPVEVTLTDHTLTAKKPYDLGNGPLLAGTYAACIEAQALRFLQMHDLRYICLFEDHYFVQSDTQVYSILVEQRARGKEKVYRFSEISETALLIHQIAAVLDYCDKMGFIHRDIKPGNIIQAQSTSQKLGDTLLLDFGAMTFTDTAAIPPLLASLRDAQWSHYESKGRLFGTPGFVSPEQARGLRLTPKTDLFSFGLTLIDIIAGLELNTTSPTSALRMVATAPNAVREDALGILGARSIDLRLRDGISTLLKSKPQDRSLEPIQQAAREILAENGYTVGGEKKFTSLPSLSL